MKLLALFTLAFAGFVAGKECGLGHHPGVLNAIGKFCQNQGMVVPSDYSTKGMSGAYDGGSVSITGDCKPKQWVPQEYCMTQFKAMCANDVKERKFGRNKCQTWKINYPAAKPKPKPADDDNGIRTIEL